MKQARKTDEQIRVENENKYNYPVKRNNNIKRKDSRKQLNNGNQVFSVEEQPLKKIPKWKMQSEQFRRAMKCNNPSTSSYPTSSSNMPQE